MRVPLLLGRKRLCLLLGCLLFLPNLGRADARKQRSLLLGGTAANPQARSAAIDPLLPRGEIRLPPGQIPGSFELCSQRRPICLVGREGISVHALELLEEAYETVAFGAGIYWEGSAPIRYYPSSGPFRVRLLGLSPSSHWDRGESFCEGGWEQSSLPRELALRCVLESRLAEMSPSISSDLRAQMAVGLASEILGPTDSLRSAAQEIAGHPERSFASVDNANVSASPREAPPFSILLRFLADGSDLEPLELGFLLAGKVATRTPPASLRYEAEPDLFDILRHSLGDGRAAQAELFDDFSRARFHIGKPSFFLEDLHRDIDARLLPTLHWDVASSGLPRHLALTRPLEAMGSAYLQVRYNQAPPPLLKVVIHCERPSAYIWSILHLSGEAELSHVRIPFQESAHHFEQRFDVPRESQRSVLIGTHLGGVDLDHPFDPDHGPHEAHSCSVVMSP